MQRAEGRPDPTRNAERSNLHMRMRMRRVTRLANAFSKKAANNARAVAIHFMAYSFVRIQGSLRCSLTTAAGVTDNDGTAPIL